MEHLIDRFIRRAIVQNRGIALQCSDCGIGVCMTRVAWIISRLFRYAKRVLAQSSGSGISSSVSSSTCSVFTNEVNRLRKDISPKKWLGFSSIFSWM